MQQIRIGTVSAINPALGTVDVKFSDRVSTGLWLLDSARADTIAVNSSVICLFPTGSGEGVCLGRHYHRGYQPGGSLAFRQSVKVEGDLEATGTITAKNFP